MSKAIRFFSLALAILMLVPLLSVFPVKVSATEQTYDETHNGELLRTVNFLSDDWHPDYQRAANGTSSNMGADVAVSSDGTSVSLTVQNGNNKRAMWGGFYPGAGVDEDEYEAALGAALPMCTGAKYTMVFDLTLGHDNVSFGIQVDGHNALSIQGNGQSRWYGWNTVNVWNASENNEKWNQHDGVEATERDTHTFAVTVDYDAKTMALYVKNEDDGAFYFCRSMTYDGENVWDSNYFRCRLCVRSLSGTPDETYTAEIANLNIYKGNAMNPLFGKGCRLPSYWSRSDGEKVLDVSYKANGWYHDFATASNVGADVVIDDEGGTSLKMTVLNESYKRAIWGGFYSESDDDDEIAAYNDFLGMILPFTAGETYTMIFDLTLGDDHVAFGIQVDGENTLSIQGNGQSRWYGWNTVNVGDTANNNEKWNYHTAPGSSRRDLHTFAVTVDYDAKTMSLYVKDEDDGAFYFCRSMTCNGANVWDSDYFRCRFNVRSIGGNPNANYTAEVANLKIYKGNVMNHLWDNAYVLPYDDHANGDELLRVNFHSGGWRDAFATTNNQGAYVSPSDDDYSVSMTVLNESYRRAMWGGFYTDAADGSPEEIAFHDALGTALPMEEGAKYTLVFNLKLGSNHVGFGIQVDGYNSLVICGDGQSRWYSWNDYGQLKNGVVQPGVGNTADDTEKWNYHTAPNTSLRDTHTFAVTVDYDTKTMALYVKDTSDGRFYLCRSMTYDGANVWDSDYFRCRLNVRSIGGTPNETYTATLSNLTIYKGVAPGIARLSVMSYNIEMQNHGSTNRTFSKALETVLAKSPDIVGLEEVDLAWEDSIDDTLTDYTRVEGDRTRDSWPELLYKTDVFDCLYSDYERYSALKNEFPDVPKNGADPNRDKMGRLFTWALLYHKASRKKVLAICTHLHYRKNTSDNNSGSLENSLVRQYEIRLLLAWIEAQTFDYDSIVIVGDMNCDYSTGYGPETIGIFKDDGFSDARETAPIKGDIGGTLDGWNPDTQTARGKRKTDNYDYILTKGYVDTAYYTVVDNMIDNGGTSYPSDHLPILTNLIVY